MAVAKNKTIKNGNSVAVRLPREVAFDADTPVTIIRWGDVVTIYPTRISTRQRLERLAALPKPGSMEIRDEEPLPERPGL